MTAFDYTVRDLKGRVIRSATRAVTRGEAQHALAASGLTLLDLRERNEVRRAGPRAWLRARLATCTPIAKGELAIFARQLAISVSSGVALREALESITDDMDQPKLRRALRGVLSDLYDGKPFSEALEHQGRAFGTLFVSLVRAAEEAGSMAETLEQIALYLEKNDRLTRKIRGLMAYPLFIAGFFLIICLIMTLAVLPRFQSMFAGFDAKLPALTLAVFHANQFILDHIIYIAGAVGSVVVGAALCARTPPGRMVVDRVKLRLPVFGPCLQKLAVARFCRTLSIMVRGGVSVASAMNTASVVCGNRDLEKSIAAAAGRIVAGSDISASLAQDKNFPRLVVRMAGVGEQSGQLPKVLEKISDAYEDQVEGTMLVAMSLAEPVFICFFGFIILIIVLAIYLPIFTVASNV